jgi:hypothetical protein
VKKVIKSILEEDCTIYEGFVDMCFSLNKLKAKFLNAKYESEMVSAHQILEMNEKKTRKKRSNE